MKTFARMLAAVALVGVPLAAHAQDRDGYQGDGRGAYARSATGHGYDADARADGDRRGDARYGRAQQDRFDRGGFDRNRLDRDRGFDRGRDDQRFRGEIGLGFGYGGYPYAGYDDGYRDGDYGAGYAYSYPDAQGTYQPFAYGYSDRDDAYYAGDGQGYGDEDGDGAYGYQAPPDAGWSAGGPPVDCGQWVWRPGRGAYQWVPAPCASPQ
jgi:hypothetical protein